MLVVILIGIIIVLLVGGAWAIKCWWEHQRWNG
jgi:hypothetical protein